MTLYRKPLPSVNKETSPYWEGCRRGELLIPRCRDCGWYQFYPRAVCGNCLSQNIEWVPSSGRGQVYSYTVIHQNQSPGFASEVPYVLAYIELEEGVRMMSNVVNCPPDEVRIGMPVEVLFEPATKEITLPKFRPVPPQA